MLWSLIVSVLFPQIANQVGWMTAEIGRQPWIVYNILRTSDGASPRVSAQQVSLSITMFLVIYALLFVLFIFLLDKKIKHGPDLVEPQREIAPVYRNPFKVSQGGKHE